MNDAFLKQAKAKAAKYCSLKERASQQVLEKLLSWDISNEDAYNIINQLVEENFLNELRFCRAFCHDKLEFNQWGKNRITLELARHKIADEIIEEGLKSIEPERYEELLRKLTEKKWQLLASETDQWKRKNKTAAYLVRKGFETDLVWESVNHCHQKDID